MSVAWRTVRFFRRTEREHAERVARRMAAEEQVPVRVVSCGRHGLKLMRGDDERREDRPVEADRRRPGSG